MSINYIIKHYDYINRYARKIGQLIIMWPLLYAHQIVSFRLIPCPKQILIELKSMNLAYMIYQVKS